MKAYKGFDKNWKCRDYQFEVGKEYVHEGKVIPCESGFHSCDNPLDILSYYDAIDSKFAIVEIDGELKTHTGDSKIASSKLRIVAELNLSQFIKASVDWHFEGWFKEVKKDKKKVDSKNYSKLAASGDGSNLAASGHGSNLAASGHGSNLAASGNYSKLAASGHGSNLAASGDGSNLAASGDDSKLAASGHGSSLAASGHGSNVIVSAEKNIIVKGSLNTLICLTHYVYDKPIKFVTAKVGEEGIKIDTWYKLNIDGNFEEC